MAELVLDAVIVLDDGARRLRLAPGDAHLLEGPGASAVVAALSGHRGGVERLRVGGRSLTRRGPAGRARGGLVVVGDDPVAPDVSIRDHLAAVVGAGRADPLLAGAPLLAGRGADPAGFLSGGERRVLGFLRAEALDPRVVALDRAGAGLDEDVLAWAGQQIARWRSRGIAVVVHPARPEERDWAR